MCDVLFRKAEGLLYNYRKLKVEVLNLTLDIEEIANNYQGCSAISYKEVSSETNKFSSVVESEVENKEKRIEILRRVKRSKEIQIERIDSMLSLLTDEEYRIIELRYFENKKFRDIAEELDKNEIAIIALRKKIINEKLIPFIKK